MSLDPRVALIAALLLDLLAVLPGPESVCWIIFALTLIPLLIAHPRRAVAYGIAFLALRILGFLALSSGQPVLGLVGGALLLTSRYLLPVGVALALYATVSVGQVIAALRWAKVPQTVVIPLSVVFRAVPAVIEETRAVWEAHLLRAAVHGTRGSWKQEIEDVTVPVLLAMLRMSDNLTAAALVRGLGSPDPTCATQLRLRVRDGLVAAGATLPLIAWAVKP